jgi:hypothetical protein
MHEHTKRRIEEVLEKRMAQCAKMEAKAISAQGRLAAVEWQAKYEKDLRRLRGDSTQAS